MRGFLRSRALAITLLLLSSFIVFHSKTMASHAVGIDLTYQCLGGNQYEFTVNFYRDCDGISAPSSAFISISSALCGINTSTSLSRVGFIEVSAICPSQLGSTACSGGNLPGIQQYTYRGTFTLPANCTDWVIGYTECCRNSAITNLQNPGSQNLYVEAKLNNAGGLCNNSPFFTTLPTPYLCAGQPFFYNHGAIDIDGDSLVYTLIQPRTSAGGNIPYSGGFSPTNPMSTSGGFNFNTQTGQMSFTPSNPQQAVVTVRVDEYRNGVLIGSVIRDLQLVVINCNNQLPTASGINGTNGVGGTYNINVCSGFPLCFDISSNDANAGQVVSLQWNGGIQGATFTSTGTPFPRATFCWTPGPGDIGTHSFALEVRDNACPIPGLNVYTYTINVTPNPNPPVSAGSDVVICQGASTTLTGTTVAPGVTYTWSPSAGLSCTNCRVTTASPAVTTVYTVTANYPDGCSGSDQVRVTVNPTPSVSVFPAAATICAGGSITLSATGSSGVTSYQWNPGGLTGASVTVSPVATTTYTVTGFDAYGCPSTPASSVITLNPPPPSPVCNNIYVTPTGTGTGLTQSSPTNLANALVLGACNSVNIKMAIGTYTINNSITNFTSYMTLEGGFDPANSWRKTSQPGATTIYRTNQNPDGPAGAQRIVAFYLNTAQYFRIQDLTIQTQDANAPAISNYVLHLTACSNYNIVRTRLICGKGGDGVSGGAGGNGYQGSAGANGINGDPDDQAEPGNGGNGGAGGGAGAGTAGTGAIDPGGCCSVGQNGGNGVSSFNARAGGGGGGGASGGEEDRAGGRGGNGGGVNGGAGVTGGNGGNGGDPGAAGANGVAGAAGTNGTPGTNGTAPAFTGGFFVPGSAGTSGTDGTGGGGGSGGGGGGGQGCTFCIDGGGNGGGGGGGGGEGGSGGIGGSSGGASIALYLYNNGAAGNFTDCNVTAGAAGTAGTGGAGGTGGNGGAGGIGASASTGQIGRGGNGGAGGRGGNGGSGGSGSAGVAHQVYQDGGQAPASASYNFNLTAQPIITATNVACTGTNITFASASSGNWNYGSGASPATGTGASVTTQYSTTGRKDITYGGTNVYSGFVNMAINNTTFVPDITVQGATQVNPTTYRICAGSYVSYYTSSLAVSYAWTIQGVTPTTYTTQNVLGVRYLTPGTYTTTLSIVTDCCGQSQPNTITMIVEDNPNLFLSGVTSYCEGGSTTITATGATTYLWSPNTGISSTTASTVTIVTQTTTTYIVRGYNASGTCYDIDSVTIVVNPNPVPTTSTVAATCGSNGSASVTVTPAGTYSYQWSTTPPQNTATASNIQQGNYQVTVTNSSTGCTATAFANVAAVGTPIAYIAAVQNVTCAGAANGAAQAAATGGTAPYTYNWGPGQTNAQRTGLAGGSYTVTVTDRNGCSATATAYINEPTPVVGQITTNTPSTCYNTNDGSLTVFVDGGAGGHTVTWSTTPPRNTLTINNLAPGNYTVTVTDANGCSLTRSAAVTSPPPFIITQNSITPTTCGGTNGSITISAIGGTGTKTYQLDSGTPQATGAFTNVPPGAHTILIADANGCDTTYNFTFNTPPPFNLTTSVTPIGCSGGTTGSILATGTGGTGTLQYRIGTGPYGSNNNFTLLPAGTYIIWVRDGVGCTLSDTVVLAAPGSLSATLVQDSVNCNGGNDGGITATGVGGTPAYQFSLNGGAYQSGTVFSNLSAGNYTVTVRDFYNCTATATIAVRQPAPTNATLVQDSVDCFGGNDGSITATGTGGTPPYQYAIDGVTFQSSGTFAGLTAGNYTITTRDSYNCTGTTNITVRQPSALTMSPVIDDLTCPSNPTGAIATNPSGGTGPYQVSLNNGAFQSSSNFLNLSTGTYTLRVRDSKGCIAYDTVVVSAPGGISISLNPTSLGCSGTLGRIVATASGGAPGGYFYQLNSGGLQANGTFNNLNAGFYTVTAYDQLGCFVSDTVTIRAAGQIVLTLVADSVTCFGQTNGQIRITNTSGGVGPYTYNINGGAYASATTFPNLAAGPYTIGVRDNSGCNATASITVGAPTQITATAVVDSINCFGGNDGSFVITASGGTGPYQYSLTGATFQVSNSFTGLSASTNANVTVRDSKGCTRVISVMVAQPAAITLNLIQDSLSCNGGNDGSIVATATGGSGGYQYSIDGTNFQASGTFTGLAAGPRTITVRDFYGCTQTANITVLQPAVLGVTLAAGGSNCSGGGGQITATATGGNGINQYSIDGTNYQASNVFSNLAANTYTVTVVDQNGCRATANITIAPPVAINVSAVQDSANCNGASDGEIIVTASGGVGTLQYSLDGTNFQASNTFTGLAAGPFTVTVRDANSCTATANITVLQPSALTIALVQDSVECFGGNDGGITVTAGGGSSGYQYSIDGTTFQASNSFTGLAAGLYTVTVRDFRNCTVTGNISIQEPAVLGVTTNITHIACSGGTSGSITVNATGGSQPYRYQINGGALQASNIFNNLAATNYTINVVDDNGCQQSVSATVLQSTPINASLVADSLSCNGAGDGIITVTATGGAGTLEYSLNSGTYQTSNVFSSLAPANYTVTVRDASGCTNQATIDVHQPAALTLTGVQDSVECNGGADGSITLTASGGSAGYNYTLNGGTPQASNVFGNLTAANYNMAVTDLHGCQATVAIAVLQPTALTISLNTTSPVCAGAGGGSITVTAGGGSPAYQYSTDGTNFQASNSFTGLAAGPYTVTLRDDNGCTVTANTNITQPVALTLSLVQDSVNCNSGNDGSITATAGGGTGVFEYSIDGANFQPSNVFGSLTAGPYTVTLRDNAGCTTTATTNVLQPAVLTAGATVVGISCNSNNDGQITVTGTGGVTPYEFNLNSGSYQSSGSFTNLTANTYTIGIRDANGCTATTTATVQQSPALTVSLVQDSVNCNGGSDGQIIATGNGGSGALQYSLNSGAYQSSGTFTGLNVNNYSVTVRDAAGCTASASINVLEPAALSVTAVQDSANCFGAADGGATATAVGGSAGYQYSLDGTTYQSSNVFTGRAAGAYTLTVRDLNGCTATTNITILQPTAITTSVTGTNISCNGGTDGTATVVANGGLPSYTYSWDNGGGSNATTSNRSAGWAVVTVTDIHSCQRKDSIQITQPTALAVVETIVPLTCGGGNTASISLNTSGGTGGYTYGWSNGPTGSSNTGLGQGTYDVTVTDANSCQWTGSWTIAPPGTITVSATTTGVSCYNTATGSATATVQGATGNIAYVWSTTPAQNTATASNVPAGPCSVTVTDAAGCTATTSVVVADAPELIATIAGVNPRCFDTNDGSIAVTANGGTGTLNYTWSQGGNTATATGLGQGNFNVTVTDANNCSVSLSQLLVSPSQLTVSLTASADSVKFGETVQLTATPGNGATGLSYAWTPSNYLSCVDCANPEAGPLFESAYNYVVTVADQNNCEAEAQVRIVVDLYDRVLYVPNAFTPNGDGLNDDFHVYGIGFKEVLFQVFDRWGEKMFETTDFTVGWDGSFKGQAMPPGVYVYQVKAIYLDGQEGYKKGSVTLIK